MDRINYNHLYYFYVVAKEGSIKAASEKLHVTQPTISDQLKLLEEYFECLLFERKNRSLSLTREGTLALKYAQKIFEMGHELTSRLRNQIMMPKKSLDIGVTNHMSQYFLYDLILPFFDQSDISINVKEDERHYLIADLEEGNLDMVFTDSKDSLLPNMDAHRVGLNKTFAVAHKKYRKFKKDFPDSLNEIPFFNYTTDSSLKYEIELYFSKHSLTPKVIGEADDIDLLQLITEQGKAFTIVPEVAKNRFLKNKDVIVLGELEEFQSSVYGIIKNSYKGLGYQLLTNKL